MLVAASWISGAIFGAYIAGFFGGSALAGVGERWNESLPELYDGETLFATIAIGAHFFAGGILLLLGPIQLIGAVRCQVPICIAGSIGSTSSPQALLDWAALVSLRAEGPLAVR